MKLQLTAINPYCKTPFSFIEFYSVGHRELQIYEAPKPE